MIELITIGIAIVGLSLLMMLFVGVRRVHADLSLKKTSYPRSRISRFTELCSISR